MFQSVRAPVSATCVRTDRTRQRRAGRAFIALAVIVAIAPVLTYVYYQWSDVYAYRVVSQPMNSAATGIVVALFFGLGVGLMLWSVTWRGYVVDFVRATLVGCVGALAALLAAMLLGL